MEENVWSSKCRTFKVSSSFPRGRPRKTWIGVIKIDLKERKVDKDIAKDRNASKSHKKLSNLCQHGKQILKRI